jgi:molybdopterin converting factor small subunit
MSEITIRLFGAFRNLQQDSELRIQVPDFPLSALRLKQEIEKQWREQSLSFDAIGLLKKSVLATDKKVLQDEDQIEKVESLALLPPVSGG